MKKIPTLLERDWSGRPKLVLPVWGPGMPPPDADTLVPTIKRDGTACAIIAGKLYRRQDCKRGKQPKPGWIACQEPDERGHWPHWAPVGDGPEDKWHRAMWARVLDRRNVNDVSFESFELCGPHFQSNPEGLAEDIGIRHGSEVLADVPLIGGDAEAFHGKVMLFLESHNIEGIVWWDKHGPVCKIKRSDFDLPWPARS